MIKINLMKGDCLEKMKEIPDKSVDLVLTDPPYGTTACKWDSVIPLEGMWKELKRIVKNERSAIVLFGSEPFSSALRMSNIKDFKYDWIWEKSTAPNFASSRYQPMKYHELISVFGSSKCNYFPQMIPRLSKRVEQAQKSGYEFFDTGAEVYGTKGSKKPSNKYSAETKLPSTIIKISNIRPNSKEYSRHPTQKPVALLEYLVKTYTNEGETVLDFTMGSGSTGVACKNLNRNFIGIERDDKYFEIAKNRIEGA